MAGGAITWRSKLQTSVALSSTEAEYMALSQCTQEAIHLRSLLAAVGVICDQPTTVFENNQGCIALAENPVNHQRTKHIDVRYHFTRDAVLDGTISIEYLPTQEQLADLLTKGVPAPRIEYLRSMISGI